MRLRQIVNPQLKVTDRCVTCHVGMASGEQITTDQKVGAAHKPVVHSPTEIGCTTCHGGQGQATEKDDAHGNVHFDRTYAAREICLRELRNTNTRH
ncbi:MAG: hypothetical protein IPK98_05990 [Chloracidobacterium sp.]|nr:hypothetical protein [Chloracidobacterium sp.]